MFEKVLIANRGAISCRIQRTLRRMGLRSLAVYSEADRHSLHVRNADESVCVGPAPASQSYLNQARILEVAQAHGARAIHPGYGFLSENAEFAERCEQLGIAFIGPTPQQMREFGLKHTARSLAQANGVPLLPGSGLLDDLADAQAQAATIGYPVMLKSTAGGGGIGMQLCWTEAELSEAFHSVERLARNNFSQGGIFLEKYVERARHIEVQIFGDGAGQVTALGERDCSLQRRNQKVVEETPAPGITDQVRTALLDAAVRLGAAVQYRSAGTVEFVFDAASEQFYFLEVNTRLQVEHGVTEEVTGVDLVEWMVRVAAGESAFLRDYRHQPQGSAIQARVYAEDPNKQFQPASGVLTEVRFAADLRVDTWVERGTEVSAHYDPMLAKVIAKADDRDQALVRLREALADTELAGFETNLDYLRQVMQDPVFARCEHYTRYLDRFVYRPNTMDVVAAGTQTIVVDYPGRTGYWDVGVPPSGPMDHYAMRLGNRIVGNPDGMAALEITVTGPTLRFNCDAVIALTGAPMQAVLNDEVIPFWRPVRVAAGATLKLRSIQSAGNRAYLTIAGGLDVPCYMGSRTTFTLGQFGGHAGRALRVGDVLRLAAPLSAAPAKALPDVLVPTYGSRWDIAVLYGPHGAPDFFTSEDIEMFFATDWEVHYNSSRTGVRLIGPKPQWARDDGGEAGLHPSNIHDNAYAIGAIDFTGDMPVILGPDGPSLGGFVCPATIVQAELWKLGQLKPGDKIRFHCIGVDQAVAMERAQERIVESLEESVTVKAESLVPSAGAGPVLHRLHPPDNPVAVCYRQAGDKYLLIEYGEQALDLNLRFRVHALMQALQARALPGIVDLTPGIRSLQVHYDSRGLSQHDLLAALLIAERALPAIEDMEVPSRIVHLPLSWDDPSTRLAIDKYMQSVRPDAPWCPSNIEFIRRINGLEDTEQVKEILFNARYLVMGLGDVYLGAPVATPMDPRHRLVTTKYNPARTWTPENAVGIGGAYLCVYGMEGPGGYQFVGRTVQMWNRYQQTNDFSDGKQWLLRFFDQIRFYPVSAEELGRMREAFVHGEFSLKVEHTTLNLRQYNQFLRNHGADIAAFKQRQQAAFDAERQCWLQAGQAEYQADIAGDAAGSDAPFEIPPGCVAVASPVTGSVWDVSVKAGDRLELEQVLVVVEAMKMEVAIEADEAGVVQEVLCAQGDPVAAGQALVIIELEAQT